MPRIDLFYYGDTSPGQPAAELYRDIEEQVVLGDQLGYHGVWVTEHHLNMRGEIPDPLQVGEVDLGEPGLGLHLVLQLGEQALALAQRGARRPAERLQLEAG